jgi:general secretion pathway protein G
MRRGHAGYTVIEILLVLGIIGILTLIATPTFLGYYQGALLRVAAEEVAAFLNQGRQLAIVQNGSICVHSSSTAMHYRQGTCAGTTWTGPGTDASGSIAVPAGITLSATADPIFNYVGGNTTGATYTITHTQSSTLVHVVVALSGRVSITP